MVIAVWFQYGGTQTGGWPCCRTGKYLLQVYNSTDYTCIENMQIVAEKEKHANCHTERKNDMQIVALIEKYAYYYRGRQICKSLHQCYIKSEDVIVWIYAVNSFGTW